MVGIWTPIYLDRYLAVVTPADTMVHINTFVIFDMETTGLPQMERNETKATEMCFIAVSRRDLERTPQGGVISTTKLSFMLNPLRQISSGAAKMNGITNDVVKYTTTFGNKIQGIIQFLEELPKPVCLVAHNGNVFDYKILQAECNDIEETLPEDLLCIDSLPAFKQLEKYYKNPKQGMTRFLEGMVTDDEDDDDDVPRYNIYQIYSQNRPTDFKLQSIYERMYGAKFGGAHRAESDCQMLLDCIIAYQSNSANFVQWAEHNCKLFSAIKAFNRYSNVGRY